MNARLLAAGGVAGAEGAAWLLLNGAREQLDAALALYEELKAEPNMGLANAPV